MRRIMIILIVISLYLLYLVIFVDSEILYRFVVEWFINPIYNLEIWGIFLFLGIMAIQGLLIPLPSEFVLLASGMIWSVWLGGVMGIVGSMAAGTLCFYVSRKGGRPLAEKFVATEDIVKNLHARGNKQSASTVIKCLKDEIFALADEKKFIEASLYAKKFLCTFGHQRNAARTDLLTLIMSIDFPRAHKILASVRRTLLQKYNGYRKGQTTK